METHTFSLVNITKEELDKIFNASLKKALNDIQERSNAKIRYIDSEELEKLYGIKKSQASKMRMNQEIPYYLVKSKVVYKTSEIEEFLAHNKIEAKEMQWQ